MRTTVDIPDPLYRELKVCAATEGVTVRELILDGVTQRLRKQLPKAKPQKRFQIPTIPSKNPGSLVLGEEGVYEYIPFP